MRRPSRDLAAGMLVGSVVSLLLDVVLHLMIGCTPV